MKRGPRKAAIAGATGLVGGYLLDRLLAEDGADYEEVRALVRRPLGRTDERLRELVVDFDRLEDLRLDVDDVFCCLGTTIKKAGSQEAFRKVDHDYVAALGRVARRDGAETFSFVSSVGADPESGNFYLRVKGEAEQALEACDFQALHIFRPSLLLGPRDESRPLERATIVGSRLVAPLLRGPLSKYHPVHAETVAAAMVAAARSGETGRRVYRYGSIVRRS